MQQSEMLPGDHLAYMRFALSLARKSPIRSSNYRVGAIILDASSNSVLATGYTLELPGNTHAEQCCLMKLSKEHCLEEKELGRVLPENTVLYTTVEPCVERLSGNVSCLERILSLGKAVHTVYVGVREPDKFVRKNGGRERLKQRGIHVIHVEGLEDEILSVATAGHEPLGQSANPEDNTRI